MIKQCRPSLILIYLALTLLSLWITSCTSHLATPPKPDQTTTTIEHTQVIATDSLLEDCPLATEEPLCQCIIEPIANMEVWKLAWSLDSQLLYFQTLENPKQWSVYSMQAKEVVEQINTLPGELLHSDYLNDKVAGVKYENLFISSEGTKTVFTERQGNDLKVKVLIDDHSAIQLGSVTGMVDKVYWNDEGTALILSLDWQSPIGIADAYAYRVDLEKQALEAVLLNDEDHQGVTVIGVTPDFQRMLFVKYYGFDRSVWLGGISAGTESKTNLLSPPLDYQWLSNNILIGVGSFDDMYSTQVYIYDLGKNIGKLVGAGSINVERNRANSALISPNLESVAFIEENSEIPFLMRCYRNK